MPSPPYTVQQLHDASVITGVKNKAIINAVAEVDRLEIESTTAQTNLTEAKTESASAVSDEQSIRDWLNINGPEELRGSL